MERNQVAKGMRQVVVDAPTVAHCVHDGGKVVVEQHDGRCFSRHLSAALTHRHADVSGPQRRSIVGAITGHRNHFTLGTQLDNQTMFVFRSGSCKHVCSCGQGRELGVGGGVELVTGGDEITVDSVVRKLQTLGHGMRCSRMIAGDHDDSNASGSALLKRLGNAFANGITERNQARICQPRLVTCTITARPITVARRDGDHAHSLISKGVVRLLSDAQHFTGRHTVGRRRDVAHDPFD